jgi:hypothetical protein
MAELPTVETGERFYSYEGKIYLVRDVRVNGKVIRVENGVLHQRADSEFATVEWHPAEEGSFFDDLKPLSKRADEA